MNTVDYYRKNRNVIRTSLGGMVEPPEGMVVCGKSIFSELVKEPMPFCELLNLMFIGNSNSKEIAKILDLIAVLACYPDPRIWCHRAGRLAASGKSSPGECLATAVSVYESDMFGGKATIKCMQFLQNGLKYCEENNVSVTEFIEAKLERKEIIRGFGRPVMKTDERVPVFMEALNKIELPSKKHLEFALECEKILVDKKNIYMNFACPYSAFFLDLGLTPETGSLLITTLVIPSLAAVIAEELPREPENFLPMSIDDLEYCGE